MTKHFCDRCGKESPRLNKVRIPVELNGTTFTTREADVCVDCDKIHDELYHKCAEIRLIMFSDYFKEGKP